MLQSDCAIVVQYGWTSNIKADEISGSPTSILHNFVFIFEMNFRSKVIDGWLNCGRRNIAKGILHVRECYKSHSGLFINSRFRISSNARTSRNPNHLNSTSKSGWIAWIWISHYRIHNYEFSKWPTTSKTIRKTTHRLHHPIEPSIEHQRNNSIECSIAIKFFQSFAIIIVLIANKARLMSTRNHINPQWYTTYLKQQ